MAGTRARAGIAVRAAGRRVIRHLPTLAIAATAAGIAYALASWAFGAENAFFAPIAAVISVGLAAGQRVQRAIEIVVGVTLGMIVADLFVRLVPFGPISLAIAVLVAMAIAVGVRASSLLVNQTAVAVVIVAVLAPYTSAGPLTRLGDAVIGGSVALVLSLAVASNPIRPARQVLGDVLDSLAIALESLAASLREKSPEQANLAAERIGQERAAAERLAEALRAARESVRIGRRRQALRGEIARARAIHGRLDVLIGTTQSLARAAANANRSEAPPHADLSVAIASLAASMPLLGAWARGEEPVEAVHDRALESARLASSVLAVTAPQTAHVIVGLVRSAVVDVLRATGLPAAEAIRALEEAAGRADG